MTRAKTSTAPAPRKTPRQDRAGRTVAILVEAAAQVIENDGLEGFNTNAVAARAGVSIGSLYQYFANKDALVVALMRRESERFGRDCVEAFACARGREALALYIDAAVRQQLARPRLARLLDVEESRPELQGESEGTVDFGKLLANVLRSPDLPPQRSARIAALDLSAIIRGLTDASGERGETDQPALRLRIRSAVFGYLEAMSAAAPGKKASKSSGRSRKTI